MRIWREISSFMLTIVILVSSFFVGLFEGFSYASYGSMTAGKWVSPSYSYRDGILELYLFVAIILLGYFLSKYIKKDFYKKTLIFTSLIISLIIFVGLISMKCTLIETIAEKSYLVKDAQPNLEKYVALIKQTIIIDWIIFSLILLTILFETIQYFISKKKDKNLDKVK